MILILKINQKLKRIPEFAETMSLYWKKWIFFLEKDFFIHHDFHHDLYNTRYHNPFYKNL